MSTAGYSDKSLAEKIGVRPGVRLSPINPPPEYFGLIGPLPEGATYAEDVERADIAHLFVADKADLAAQVRSLTECLASGSALWISWPKKSSPRFIDLTEGASVNWSCQPVGWM
jgi:hypothetical protein